MSGRILKGIGGFYYVKTADGEIHTLRACGRFRQEGVKPLPGDEVEFRDDLVTDILPRKNVLVRPAVANMDMLVIVLSASKPKCDLLLADRLIVYAKHEGIEPVICVNKADTAPIDRIAAEYEKAGVDVMGVSAKTGEGMDALKDKLRGKYACFAGQSAVGKSSILNCLVPELNMETGGLSRKTDRGRHTTRYSSIIYIDELDAALVDTPGFSILSTADLEPEELSAYYAEFEGAGCRFTGCLHKGEPDCGVKARIAEGSIPKGRYERYITFLEELIERRENKYD